MQQLQSSYRGDGSSSLAQIFGMQYQPQLATSQMANTALASGMSAGAQVKTTAMNNATQMAIADANRFENRRQFNLSNTLANRIQDDTAYNNNRITDFNTMGVFDQKDREAAGMIEAKIGELTSILNQFDPNSEEYLAIQEEINNLRGTANRGAARGRGGLAGAAGYGNVDAKGNNAMTIRAGSIATLNQSVQPGPTAPAPVPVEKLPQAQTPTPAIAPTPAPAPAPASVPTPTPAATTTPAQTPRQSYAPGVNINPVFNIPFSGRRAPRSERRRPGDLYYRAPGSIPGRG